MKTHRACSSCWHLKMTMVTFPDSSQLPYPDGPSTLASLSFVRSSTPTSCQWSNSSFVRERTATEQQHQGLSPFVNSTQTPTYERLEFSVQLSSRLFFEQRGNPKTPRLSQFTSIQNPSLKVTFEILQCDSTTVRRPLARIALLARSLCEARFHLADLAGYLAVQKLPIWQPSCSRCAKPDLRAFLRYDILSLHTAPWRGAHV